MQAKSTPFFSYIVFIILVLAACNRSTTLAPEQEQPPVGDSTNIWTAISRLPEEFIGDWISTGGGKQFALRHGKLTQDGIGWSFNAMETDSTDLRLILGNGNVYRTVYLRNSAHRYGQIRFSMEEVDCACEARALQTEDWVEYYRCYIPEKDLMPLGEGARWVYDYAFQDRHYNHISESDTHSDYFRKGILELRIDKIEFSAVDGPVFNLVETFNIGTDSLHSYGGINRPDSPVSWDSTSVSGDTTVTLSFKLAVRGDSLLLRTDTSEVFFAPQEYRDGISPYLGIFVYPVPGKPDLPLRTYTAKVLKGTGIEEISAFEGQFGNIGYETKLTIKLSTFTPGIPE